MVKGREDETQSAGVYLQGEARGKGARSEGSSSVLSFPH